MAVPRAPLWRLLLERGLAATERQARALCLSGEVLVDGVRVDKPGVAVPSRAAVALRRARPYASRGGEKLAFALPRFGVAVAGRVALDCGASTGGFTDCLLQHGAARVYAVDVGFGQLLGRLRQDPRVVDLERTNLSEVGAANLAPPPTLVTLDLSYLPLAEAWTILAPWLPAGAEVLSLVKPLFEVQEGEAPGARRTGVIPGRSPYVEALWRLRNACAALGWSALGVAASPVRGGAGTIEFFLHAALRPGEAFGREAVEAAVQAALGTPPGPAGV